MTARILIVDDQPDIRKLIRLTLEHLDDVEVYEASNGSDGWRLAQDLRPDLILLDVMMPGELDGYQVCTKVKRDPMLGPRTKVILLTARAQQEDKEQGRKADCDAYLTKAFSPLKLLDLVDSMLGREA
jgi:CheY-like chemotaxis protein